MVERAPRRDVQRNRAALVDAARAAFAEHGLDAPLEPIAVAAGLGNATLYRHFPTRAALWEAVLVEPLREVQELVASCRALPDPWDGFAGFLRRTAEVEARRDGFSALMTTRFAGAPTLLALRRSIQADLEALFRAAQDAGAIRPDAALEDVAVAQVAIAAVIARLGEVAPGIERRWVDLVLDGFRAAPGTGELGAPPLRPNQVWRGLMRRG